MLEDILDLDLSVSETDDFIQLVSGEKIVLGSIPLAHRYGGHQVRVAPISLPYANINSWQKCYPIEEVILH